MYSSEYKLIDCRVITAGTKAVGYNMRKIEFKIRRSTGMMCVFINDKLIPDINFDVKVVHEAVRDHRVAPIMRENLLKNLKRKLEDSGFSLQPEELKFIVGRFEREFNAS